MKKEKDCVDCECGESEIKLRTQLEEFLKGDLFAVEKYNFEKLGDLEYSGDNYVKEGVVILKFSNGEEHPLDSCVLVQCDCRQELYGRKR